MLCTHTRPMERGFEILLFAMVTVRPSVLHGQGGNKAIVQSLLPNLIPARELDRLDHYCTAPSQGECPLL